MMAAPTTTTESIFTRPVYIRCIIDFAVDNIADLLQLTHICRAFLDTAKHYAADSTWKRIAADLDKPNCSSAVRNVSTLAESLRIDRYSNNLFNRELNYAWVFWNLYSKAQVPLRSSTYKFAGRFRALPQATLAGNDVLRRLLTVDIGTPILMSSFLQVLRQSPTGALQLLTDPGGLKFTLDKHTPTSAASDPPFDVAVMGFHFDIAHLLVTKFAHVPSIWSVDTSLFRLCLYGDGGEVCLRIAEILLRSGALLFEKMHDVKTGSRACTPLGALLQRCASASTPSAEEQVVSSLAPLVRLLVHHYEKALRSDLKLHRARRNGANSSQFWSLHPNMRMPTPREERNAFGGITMCYPHIGDSLPIEDAVERPKPSLPYVKFLVEVLGATVRFYADPVDSAHWSGVPLLKSNICGTEAGSSSISLNAQSMKLVEERQLHCYMS